MEVKNLLAYIYNVNMTVKEFAEIIDYDPSYVAALGKGQKTPSAKSARAIKRATGGVIDLSDKVRPRPKRSENNQQIKQDIE